MTFFQLELRPMPTEQVCLQFNELRYMNDLFNVSYVYNCDFI